MSTQQTYYTIAASRVMIGGRVFSRGDTISSKDLGPFRHTVRSGAVKPLPRGIRVQLTSGNDIEVLASH